RDLARHQVVAQISLGLPLVRLDFVLTQQALTNLLLNAAVHTPSGTRVLVGARAEEDTLVMTVADNGPGLPVEAVPFIFEKFYRAPTAPAGGTGLGLAIVKGFIEAQGGRVQAENQPEGGAAFTLRLPLAKAPPVTAEAVL